MTLDSTDPQIVKLSKGETSVYIEAQKVEEILQDNVIKIELPQVSGDQGGDKAPLTFSVGLNRIKHVFNIQGFLSARTGSGNETTYSTAKEVKDALIKNILYPAGSIQLEYRNYVDSDYGSKYGDDSSAETTYVKTVLDKVSLIDASLRTDASNTEVTRYSIQINLTK